ncbi:uncharacterized protein LOC125756701 [Rhipicephalus sanguineus]|uniref:uncharacterized protein LOC125756701 n=1 Tax=Rhipicephalus sanguineus TaxID=34632 RepID=UPI0020C442EB|nr:uncharacterized protein LOC125756701 [Rhipicephalus sanguineus]
MREPSVKEVSSDSVILKTKVNHSQSLNRPPVDSWALCKCDGEVVAAHCIRAWPGTAMRAPMSRHCFFYVEYGVRVRQERSCTDSANSWLPTHIRKLDVRPSIAEMDFASSTMKKRRLGADASAAREPKSPCRASSTHWRLWPCETEYTNALLKAMPASAVPKITLLQ